MGLFDGLFSSFFQSGQNAAGNVTKSAPTTSTGTPYTSNQSSPTTFSNLSSGSSSGVNVIGGGINAVSNLIGSTVNTIVSPISSVIVPAAASGLNAAKSFVSNPSPILSIITNPVTAIPATIGAGAAIIGASAFAARSQPETISASATVGGTPQLATPATPDRGINTYAPWGNLAQIELKNTKSAIDPTTGEIAIYQLKEGRSGSNEWDWQLVSGGGMAAAQSGAFTVNAPETPVVYNQYGADPGLAASADMAAAEKVLSNPAGYSRLGAEAYGGYVMPLDNRTVQSTGAQLSTYSNPNNLANYADPQGVNQNAKGAKIPWNLPAGSADISYMGPEGITGPAVNTVSGAESVIAPSAAAAIPTINGNAISESAGVLRPSDFDLEVTRVLGGGPVSAAIIAASDFFIGGRTLEKTSVQVIESTPKVTYGESWQEVKDLGDGNYEITTYTPVTTESGKTTVSSKTSTPLPSGFAYGEQQFSEQVSKQYLPESKYESTGSPVDYISSLAFGAYEGVREKPLSTAVYAGVGVLLAATGAGIEALAARTVAGTAGTSLAPIAAGTSWFATKAAPAALAGLYIADVGGRSTNWLSDFSPQATYRLGGILSTEAVPMLAGGAAFAYRSEIAAGAKSLYKSGESRFTSFGERVGLSEEGTLRPSVVLETIEKEPLQKAYAPGVLEVDLTNAKIEPVVDLLAPRMTTDLPFYYSEAMVKARSATKSETYDPFTGMDFNTVALALPEQVSAEPSALLRGMLASRRTEVKTLPEALLGVTTESTKAESEVLLRGMLRERELQLPITEVNLQEQLVVPKVRQSAYSQARATSETELSRSKSLLANIEFQTPDLALDTIAIQTPAITELLTVESIQTPISITDTLADTALTNALLKRTMQVPEVTTETITDQGLKMDLLITPRLITTPAVSTIVTPETRTITDLLTDTQKIVIPTIVVPPLGASFAGGGGAGPRGKKRRFFLEEFWMGLDVSGPVVRPPKGINIPKIRGSALPGGIQKVRKTTTRRKKKK